MSTIVAPAALVVTAAIVWAVNVPGLTGNTDLIRAVSSRDPYQGLAYFKSAIGSNTFALQEVREQLLSYASAAARDASVPQDVKTELVRLALSEAEAQLQEVPEDARMRLQYAQTLESTGNLDAAVQQAEIARTYSPKKQGILYQVGIGKWRQGDVAAARALFEEAYALDTSNNEAARYAAVGAYAARDAASGDAILLQQFGTTTVDHDLLRFAYYDTGMFDRLLRSARLKRDMNPDDQASVFLHAQALVLAGRAADARAELARAALLHPEWSANIAQLSRELGI
jgi:hypothetical protein